MNKLENMKKKIDRMVEKISIEEVINRIEKDKKEYEIIELVYNWEYENDVHTYAYKEEVYSNKLKEEVNIWKEGTLALAA